MNNYMLTKLRAQRAILQEVAEHYSGRTIDNIIQNFDARIKFWEEKENGTVQK